MSEQDEHPNPRPAWSRPVSWTSRPTDQTPIGHTAPEVTPTEVPPPGAYPPGDPSPGQPPYSGQAPYPGQANAGQPPYGGQGVPPGYGGRPNGEGGRIFGITLLVFLLMAVAAMGGGAAGAWVYAQANADDGGGPVTVVDAPQLDYTSLASIASQVSPSVVQIRAGDGSGSGVVLSDEGYILTNAHVVESSQGERVSVRFSDGDTAPASVVGADARSDIAVVRVEGVPVEPAVFGDSDKVLVGDTVLAIGSPLDFQGSVTQGIISGLDRTLPVGGADQRRSLSGLLQTDASINPGNSGGPLVNMAGEVIGINTAIATDGVGSGFLGLGFAVPSNRATDVAAQLIAGEEVRHAFMGVSVTPVDAGGALIGEVAPNSPAEE